MTISNELNRVKFIAEDFQTYRNEADIFFQTNYPEEFNNLIATDLGNALMDQSAFAMQALSFLVNRKASELFLATARLNSSITKLARMLGYPIQSAAPATTSLTINLTKSPYTFPVIIPVGFKFKGPGDTVYEYQGNLNFVIPPGVTSATIPIKEGQSKRITFVSKGSANQQFNILGVPTGQFIYSDELLVTVDGNLWTKQDIIKYEALNIFEITFTETPPKLRFGDGIAGNIPPTSSQIVLFYRYGKGSSGAIGKNQITGTNNSLVIGGISIPMTFTNLVSDVGQDPEDIRHVRSFASSYFRTQNAAVVKQDYDTIAGLQTGVALADSQVIRGIDSDITIQNNFSLMNLGNDVLLTAVDGIQSMNVSGLSFLGVSESYSVSGVENIGVSGSSFLSVEGIDSLSVSGSDANGNLGIAGLSGLYVGGVDSLGVSGLSFLGISGQSSVSGQDFLGIEGQAGLVEIGVSGVAIVNSGISGLTDYLSQAMSDTCQANQVQMVILSSDANNKYISPSTTVLQTVQSTLQNMADAVVTVIAVDGYSKIVNVTITVQLGISQTAVVSDVTQTSLNSLTSSVIPFGLLVKRSAGVSLYLSDIEDAIRSANNTGDIRYINVIIQSPTQYLDLAGNLIIGKQQIIQNETVNVIVKQRFLINGDVINV